MRRFWVVPLAVLWLGACSSRVPATEMSGKYVVSYPFGTSTLVLNPDESFVQTVTIKDEGSTTVRGTWSFDASRSVLSLHGAVSVVDGYGHLQREWRTPTDMPDVPVERLWFRINLETSEEYPYIRG